ncbi:galactokinase [Sphingomonas adhaesiva]|uniref:galactokinase n=1 Tax=Sphingomonas adhaesiva TaxID=28212 RepID=UPI002FFB05C0
MNDMTRRLLAGFRAAFDRDPDGVVRAPGRVNLIGEHTDYNDGFVLPCALDVETRIAWARRDDAQVRAVALEYGAEHDAFALSDIAHHAEGGWRDYVRGMIATLAGDGVALTGVDMAIVGDIPRGAGLSSSASLEVAVGHAMLAAAGLPVDAATVAVQAQRAENDFVGMKCGVMDQLASAASVADAALLIDCRDLSTTPVPLPADAAILIVHSGVSRGLVEGHYNRRRAECEEAAAAIGVAKLRDADADRVRATAMPDEVAARARHVVTENARVLAAAEALRRGDLIELGRLMAQSHASMRDDFRITVPAIDALVAIAQSAIATLADGRGGARMTGGGFGGAIVAVAPRRPGGGDRRRDRARLSHPRRRCPRPYDRTGRRRRGADGGERVTFWTIDDARGAARQAEAHLPEFAPADVVAIDPQRDVWDMWPIADRAGRTVVVDGRQYWFFLAVDRRDDPEWRHDAARIHLYSRGSDGWRHHGAAFPDGFAPGSREWSGTAVLDADGTTLTMHFTAAGRAGQPRTFEQRLFVTTGRFADGRVGDWTPPVETARADGALYRHADQPAPVDDRIKGFRDPGYWYDPATGREHILFTGSGGDVADIHDGVIGIATRDGNEWHIGARVIDATGVNSELERPHIVAHGGLLYLFWSTQAKRFAPGIGAPTGLYGMVAETIDGPWRPLNGSGLVAGNPAGEPFQAYCWWVTGEGEVISFVDYWGLQGGDPATGAPYRRAHFGGTAAPLFRVELDGDRATIVAATDTLTRAA